MLTWCKLHCCVETQSLISPLLPVPRVITQPVACCPWNIASHWRINGMLGWTEINWLYNLYRRCPCNFSSRKSQKWNISVRGRGGILLCHCPISIPLSFPVQPILWRWELHLVWMQMHLYRQFNQQHLMAGRMQRWRSTWILDWCRRLCLIFSWFNEEVFLAYFRQGGQQRSGGLEIIAFTWLGCVWRPGLSPLTNLTRAYDCVDRSVFMHVEEISSLHEDRGFICILNDDFDRGLVHVGPTSDRIGTYVGRHHC